MAPAQPPVPTPCLQTLPRAPAGSRRAFPLKSPHISTHRGASAALRCSGDVFSACSTPLPEGSLLRFPNLFNSPLFKYPKKRPEPRCFYWKPHTKPHGSWLGAAGSSKPRPPCHHGQQLQPGTRIYLKHDELTSFSLCRAFLCVKLFSVSSHPIEKSRWRADVACDGYGTHPGCNAMGSAVLKLPFFPLFASAGGGGG